MRDTLRINGLNPIRHKKPVLTIFTQASALVTFKTLKQFIPWSKADRWYGYNTHPD
jgi:hypothetical protein